MHPHMTRNCEHRVLYGQYTILGRSVKEKDLGVTISAAMTVSKQCGIAASKGNKYWG